MLLFAGCDGDRVAIEASGKLVKVGFIGPLTGENDMLGTNSLRGAQAVLRLQPYLPNGDRVEIVALDDHGDPVQTRAAVEKLIKEDSVSVILLGGASNSVLPVTEMLDEHMVPGVALLATHPDVSKTEYTIQLPFDDELQGTVAALFVMDEMIVDKVGVLFESQEEHSTFLAQTFSQKFIKAGGKVEVIEYSSNREHLLETLAGLRESGISFLYLPIASNGVVEIKKACRAIGYNPEVMLSDGLLSSIFMQYNDDIELVEGMMATDFYTRDKITREYGEILGEGFDRSITTPKTTYAALGVEGMSIVLSAMNGCDDSTDRVCIKGNLHTVSNFQGVNGLISIGSDGKTRRPVFINKIADGKLTFEVMVY